MKWISRDKQATMITEDIAYEVYRKNKLFRILTKCKKSEDCLIWPSLDTDGYTTKTSMKLPDGRKVVRRVYRAVFLLERPSQEDVSLEVSHLCHMKACCNIQHLSQEPHHVNLGRKMCRELGQCTSHRGYSNCILYKGVLQHTSLITGTTSCQPRQEDV
ncbi:Hypp798 [Branchiostoma lanceolatum]|uniref:Hypp798 protein n=1 Tax=Branchiostoma lanceolatum TaxID=7740 RepID=A0A8J9YKC7_BRALA|nr:Hypp798 [Branchiostoma lanceolatum]